MTGTRLARFVLAIVTASACLGWNGEPLGAGTSFVGEAEARIGRPATPLSYAGVARRTTRRAVAVGAATATTTRCTQVVNAYGQVITRCRR